jgi:hypothetical protein
MRFWISYCPQVHGLGFHVLVLKLKPTLKHQFVIVCSDYPFTPLFDNFLHLFHNTWYNSPACKKSQDPSRYRPWVGYHR